MHDFLTPDGHTLLDNIQLLCQKFRVAGNHSAASHHKYCADRLFPVQLPDTGRHHLCHFLDVIRQKGLNLLCSDHLRQSHNIQIFNRLLDSCLSFDLLRGIKIYQTMLNDNICETVSRHGNHSVGRNSSILCNGNIAGACPHIHQRHIQHAKLLRNGYLNGGNGLQRHVCHMQPRQLHRLVETVHHIIRQKRGDQVHRHMLYLVALQVSNLVTVHIVTHRRIAYTVKFHIRIIGFLKFLVGLLHPHGRQGIHILLRDLVVLVEACLRMGGHRPQHAPCGCDTDLRQLSAQILLQLFLDLGNGLSHLADIMNLSVQHGSGLMLPAPLRQHMEFISVQVTYRANNAPGTDIQSEHQLPLSFSHSRHV